MLFGLNENANITLAINEATTIISDILSLSQNSSSDASGAAETQQAIKMAREILY